MTASDLVILCLWLLVYLAGVSAYAMWARRREARHQRVRDELTRDTLAYLQCGDRHGDLYCDRAKGHLLPHADSRSGREVPVQWAEAELGAEVWDALDENLRHADPWPLWFGEGGAR